MDSKSFRLESFISTVLSESRGDQLRSGSKRMLTTLITCFACFMFKDYFSYKIEEIPPKHFSRFISSFTKVAQRIKIRETPNEEEMGYVKFWCDTYVCKLFRDDQYPNGQPSWNEPLFSGILRKFILRSIVKKNARFIYSLQKGTKAGCLPLNVWALADSFKSHRERLCRPEEDCNWDMITEIELVVDEIFSDSCLGPRIKFAPSGSACFEYTRTEGGASKFVDPLRLTDVEGAMPPLWEMNRQLNVYRKETFNEIRSSSQNEIESCPLCELHARVVPVDDPLKKRIITCHCGRINTALQPIQGQMLHAWKNSRFSTMRGQDCTELVRQVDSIDLPFLISGDYKAATDLINKTYCETVLGRLVDRGIADAGLALYSQCGVILHYPEVSNVVKREMKRKDGSVYIKKFYINPVTFQLETEGKKEILFPKCRVYATNGQTMGGPVSFSTLCLINLAAYRRAVKIWRDEPLGEYPSCAHQTSWDEFERRNNLAKQLLRYVVINGDDILFKSDDRLYEIWKETVLIVGLHPSQGKNFKSKDFCMINSQLFKRVNGVLERQGYLNQGMIYGIEDFQLTNPIQFAQGLNEMFSICPEARSTLPLVMSRFNNRYGDFSPNWFIHPALGGFGIRPEFSLGPIVVTRDQRAMATEFKRNPNLALHRMLRSNDRTSFPEKLKKIFDNLIKVKIVQGEYVQQVNEELATSNEWIGRFSLISYLSNPLAYATDKSDYKNVKMKRSKRKKLMDVDKCLNHDIRFFITNPVPCPPLWPLPKRGSWEYPSGPCATGL